MLIQQFQSMRELVNMWSKRFPYLTNFSTKTWLSKLLEKTNNTSRLSTPATSRLAFWNRSVNSRSLAKRTLKHCQRSMSRYSLRTKMDLKGSTKMATLTLEASLSTLRPAAINLPRSKSSLSISKAGSLGLRLGKLIHLRTRVVETCKVTLRGHYRPGSMIACLTGTRWSRNLRVVK